MTRTLAIFFGVGLLKPAAGTWGSLVAMILGLLIVHFLGFYALALATLAVTALGFWACAVELKDRPGDDPGEFVIDEVAGQWLTLLFPAAGFTFAPAAAAWVANHGGWMPWPVWVFPFVLFRLFDIWKPSVIGRADRRGDAAGVMLDDLWAGLFAGILTLILAMAYHIPMILLNK
jgi:phosphatidylglycerophosphatase A